MSQEQDLAFAQLREQWLRHDHLRRAGAGLQTLWASRADLDDARHRMAVARAA